MDLPQSYYHVYARGVNKTSIFEDDQDYTFYLGLLKRYLSKNVHYNKKGESYTHLYNKLELLSFCLMRNHFHLLLYQQEAGAMSTLMRGVMTSYSRYYNLKYSRRGPLFESRYKASRIDADNYLEHISRYIHLNPHEWEEYAYSSLPYMLGHKKAEWLRSEKVMEKFKSSSEYLGFLRDYEGQKEVLAELKYELADATIQ